MKNSQAFPSEQSQEQEGQWNRTYQEGMTFLDYFAGQALAGLTSRDIYSVSCDEAYRIADAMLLARGEEK